tara:strand:+ start:787 stop:1011 length:225 start_codon:yes stop_codon:yes gene_type:complete
MKYVLILYVCSFLNSTNTNCTDSHVVPLEFNNYESCILQGYKSSHNTLKELYGERIESEKLAIRFYCREVGENA